MCGESFLSLTQLYMPIIGIDSYGLYAALSTLKENEKHSLRNSWTCSIWGVWFAEEGF